jgi:hypothetical protein
MHPAIRYTLGIAMVVQVGVAPLTAAGQAAGPNACMRIDAAEWVRLTGKKDVLGRGPLLSPPDESPPNTSICSFLSISVAVRPNMTAERFARIRQGSDPTVWKTESISGLGDEAYYRWDSRPDGSSRSVTISYRSGSTDVGLEHLVPADSIEATKRVLLGIAKSTASKVR